MMKYIVLLFAGLFALIAGISYSLVVSQMKKVDVTALPNYATITQDSSSFHAETGNFYLNKGTYLLTAKAEGFADTPLLVETNTDRQYIVQLNPVSDQAKQWYEDNIEEVRDYEALSGQILQEEGEQFRQHNPIVNKLPYRSFLFAIGYQRDIDRGGDAIILTIDAPDIYLSSAFEQIKEWGYKPSDYHIKFTQGNDREFTK